MITKLITPKQAEDSQPTCEQRIKSNLDSRIEDLEMLWSAYCGEECPKCEGAGEIKKSPKSKAKNPKMIECPLCKGEGRLDEDSYSDSLGNIFEYGLSFDYCTPDKDHDGYFRYQLSWGGPGDEFRIYAHKRSDYDFVTYKISYVFQDWFDSAEQMLYGTNRNLLQDIFDGLFVECGTANCEYEKSMSDWEPDLDE